MKPPTTCGRPNFIWRQHYPPLSSQKPSGPSRYHGRAMRVYVLQKGNQDPHKSHEGEDVRDFLYEKKYFLTKFFLIWFLKRFKTVFNASIRHESEKKKRIFTTMLENFFSLKMLKNDNFLLNLANMDPYTSPPEGWTVSYLLSGARQGPSRTEWLKCIEKSENISHRNSTKCIKVNTGNSDKKIIFLQVCLGRPYVPLDVIL